jgi:hypothetical protein
MSEPKRQPPLSQFELHFSHSNPLANAANSSDVNCFSPESVIVSTMTSLATEQPTTTVAADEATQLHLHVWNELTAERSIIELQQSHHRQRLVLHFGVRFDMSS